MPCLRTSSPSVNRSSGKDPAYPQIVCKRTINYRPKFLSKRQNCVHVCVLSRGRLSLPGSSVLRIFQARILEWVAISYSRGSSRLGSNPRLLRLTHWQAASLALRHLGNPKYLISICANCQKLLGCCWSLTSQMN